MRKNKLTIKEIAEMAGVSPTAVSFVINDKKGVSDDTRKKILKIIEETNFMPNENSRRLFFKRSFMIGIIYSNITSPFENVYFMELARGIISRGRELGYNVLFWEKDENENKIPEIIARNDIDGIIFLQDADLKLISELNQMDIPFVIADAIEAEKEVSVVKTDYYTATYRAMQYLIEMGHNDIALVSRESNPGYYLQCFSAYKDVLEEHKMPMNFSWVQGGATNEETAYFCAEKIMSTDNKPDAIFCSADIYAIGVIKYMKDIGIKVPEQVSVMAVDNILISSYIDPGITSVDIDKNGIGVAAMDMIYKKINGEKIENSIFEPGEVIVRDSVLKI